MATNDNKWVLSIELHDYVRKLTINGQDKDNQTVMREELNDDDLELVTGGVDRECSLFLADLEQHIQGLQGSGSDHLLLTYNADDDDEAYEQQTREQFMNQRGNIGIDTLGNAVNLGNH